MNRGRAQNYSSRGRSSRSVANSAHPRHTPVRSDNTSSDASFGGKDGLPLYGRQNLDRGSELRNPYHQNFPLPGTENISSDMGELMLMQDSPDAVKSNLKLAGSSSVSGSALEKDLPLFSAQSNSQNKHQNAWRTKRGQTSDAGAGNCNSLHSDSTPVVSAACVQDELSSLVESGIKDKPSMKGFQCGQTSCDETVSHESSDNSKCQPVGVPFDICPVRTGGAPVMLKAPLFVKNREKRNEVKRAIEGLNINILRPGMVLLKNHLSCKDQARIVKKCRELGLGAGGFYQPGYRDGARLHLKMMCLGKNWDPDNSKYIEQRLIDGAKAPSVPNEFCELVKEMIQDSHAYLKKNPKVCNVEDMVPFMSPNICIVNFYLQSGRLGLHQDKDESQDSLRKGLPVVSFSIGDAAEFLYGDERDIDKADKVKLESGDVLIFGGKSRHIFHGVAAIQPGTAPKALLEETKLIPGRLNLTFREY